MAQKEVGSSRSARAMLNNKMKYLGTKMAFNIKYIPISPRCIGDGYKYSDVVTLK